MHIILTSLDATVAQKPCREHKCWILKRAVFAFSLERELFRIRKFLSTKIASFLSLDNKCLLMSMLSCTFIISNNHDLITIYTWCLFDWWLWCDLWLLRFRNLLRLCNLAIQTPLGTSTLEKVLRCRFFTNWCLEAKEITYNWSKSIN